MANLANLLATIAANVYTNHNNEVTAQMVKDALGAIVSTMGQGGYIYKGLATTSTNPSSPDANVFYIATAAGTYTNFGGIVVNAGEVAILKGTGTSWSKDVTGAATAAKLTELGHEVSGYFINENASVNTNSQRFKSYTIAAGSRVILRVTNVSGTSATWSAYWIKGGGNEAIFSGMPMGYCSDILTIPNDATGVQIFMTPAASGNINHIEIFNADTPPFLIDKIGDEGLAYLNNRRFISKSFNLSVGNAATDLITINELLLHPRIHGDIYVYISGTAKLNRWNAIGFWDTSNNSAPTAWVYSNDLQYRSLFKVYDSTKTLMKVSIAANVVQAAGTLNLVIFAVEPSAEYLDYPLMGRKIMCFGDSITQFKGTPGTDLKRYTDHLREISGADVFNAGIGGTRLAYRETPSANPQTEQACIAAFEIVSLVTAWATNTYTYQDAALSSGHLTADEQTLYTEKLNMLKATPVEAFDIVTIFGGTNDYTGGSAIGMADAGNTDKGTIYGAVNSMVSALLAAKPTLKIVFFEPIIRMFGNSVSLSTSSDVYVHPDGGGKTLPEFCEYIQDAVKLNHEPFCDWYWDLGWNVYNFTEYFGTDYTHPYLGFRYIAERMYKYLLSV